MTRNQALELARLGAAAVVAPLAAPVVALLLMQGSFGVEESSNTGFAWVFGFGALSAYLGLFLFGIPTLVVLKRLGRLDLVTMTVAGGIIGIVVLQLALLLLGLLLGSSSGYDIRAIAYGAAAGALVAFCFRLIAGPALDG